MYRLASLFAVACVALAASAFLKNPPAPTERPFKDNDQNDQMPTRLAALPGAGTALYHARFSLN